MQKFALNLLVMLFSVSLGTWASAQDDHDAHAAHVMDSAVWIDVRTVEEYNDDHIDGDLNIPLATIDVEQFAATYGKDAEINLYCRSGNRAGQAKTMLEAAGFTNVVNRGGIGDVRALRSPAQ